MHVRQTFALFYRELSQDKSYFYAPILILRFNRRHFLVQPAGGGSTFGAVLLSVL